MTNVTQEMVYLHLLWLDFSYCTIAVLVIVLFMKCDALKATEFGMLKPEEQKLPQEEWLSKMKEYVKEMEEKNPAWGMLTTKRYPPKNCVYLESKYGDLVKCNLEDLFGVRYAQT